MDAQTLTHFLEENSMLLKKGVEYKNTIAKALGRTPATMLFIK